MKDFNFNVVNKKKKVIDYFVRPHSKCTSLVIYLPPPNFAFCNDVSREIEDSADAKFLGANKVYYGARANGAFCCPTPPPPSRESSLPKNWQTSGIIRGDFIL